MAPNGALKCRTFRSIGSEEQKWDHERIDDIVGVPWQPVPGRNGIELKPRAMMPNRGTNLTDRVKTRDLGTTKRDVYLKPKDFDDPQSSMIQKKFQMEVWALIIKKSIVKPAI